jgi:hypothetical protein
MKLADNWAISRRATANEINCALPNGKQTSLWRIASLTFLGTLTVAAFFAAVAPLPARADNDKDSRHGHEDNDKGIHAKIEALEAQVVALQDEVKTLQGQLAAVQSNHALLLGPFVDVDPNPEVGVIGPNITFSGANIHIVSGSGATNDNGSPSGLGNLIIGYDEDPNLPLTGDSSDGLPIMQAPGFPSPLSPGDRGGSHNLVIGGGNRFTQAAFGGLVVGERNTIKFFGASVSGGFNNTASGLFASVSAGVRNIANGQFSSVSGGGLNGTGPSVGGSVNGGFQNTASGPYASVSGGFQNTVSGEFTSVNGGFGNTASGSGASVSGGGNNTASGDLAVVLGGTNVTDNNANSIAPGAPLNFP